MALVKLTQRLKNKTKQKNPGVWKRDLEEEGGVKGVGGVSETVADDGSQNILILNCQRTMFKAKRENKKKRKEKGSIESQNLENLNPFSVLLIPSVDSIIH